MLFLLQLFVDAPSSIEVDNIDKRRLKLKIASIDLPLTDRLIHNSGENKRFTVDPDVYGENYLNYLGVSFITLHINNVSKKSIKVGTGHLRSEIRLEPKEDWKVEHIIQVVDEEYNKKIEQLEQLLNNPLELFRESCRRTEMYS